MIEGFHLLFHESGLAPLFHPLSASFSQKNHFFGVFQVCPTVPLLSEYAPGSSLQVGKKKIARPPILSEAVQILWSLSLRFFTHFHSARLKTLYILPPLPPIQPNHPPHAPPPQNDHVISNKWYFVFHTLWFRHSKHHFSVQHAFTKGLRDLA